LINIVAATQIRVVIVLKNVGGLRFAPDSDWRLLAHVAPDSRSPFEREAWLRRECSSAAQMGKGAGSREGRGE